ncbi:methyltransferase domain-containing protein [Thioclava sp. GXIMD4216]|uniref:Methyltransferase domain-containing protein n=1 Tax=Thioclava litoralis TaxID=3076557 RepID=A0ABZ1E4G1_9RHOB|nr:methyltransferase domain-containing protein [Thioclava sp. FTW29]
MTTPPLLTDRPALDRQRLRARARGLDAFLQEEAVADLQERLIEVNRTFTSPALIAAFPEIWTPVLPDAKIVPDAEVLDLEEGAHDLVVHAFALHWANDPVGQIVQAMRALKPDGLFIGILFGGQTLHELRAALAEAEAAVTGGLSPRVVPMGEVRDLGALLQRVGLALPVADSVTRDVAYTNPMRLFADLRAMGETNALAGRRRHFTRRAVLMRALDIYLAHYADAEGRIHATFETIWLTGWTPHESQQQPLRPGSARRRLADALGTFELPTGEKPV